VSGTALATRRRDGGVSLDHFVGCWARTTLVS
jgi:hypothetical protein